MDKAEPTRERRTVAEQVERAWSNALLAVSTVEEEAAKVAQWFAGRAGGGQEDAKRLFRELTQRLEQQRRTVETNIEDAAKRTLAKFRVPRRDDIQALQARLDRAAERVEALARRSNA